MSYLKIFIKAFFLVSLVFFLSGCAILEKQRQQLQVVLSGKTITVENKSEDDIYLALVEWSEDNSAYRKIENLDSDNGKTITIDSYFFSERGNFNLGGSRDAGTKGGRSSSSIITYEVTFTVSGNQVTAVPRLRRYCRGRDNRSDVKGDFSNSRCQRIDNSFNGFTFRILNYFNDFYGRVERVVSQENS